MASNKSRLGQCYPLSFEHVALNWEWRLVHGRIHYLGERSVNHPQLDHAWTERGVMLRVGYGWWQTVEVYDPVFEMHCMVDAWNHMFRAERFAVYSPAQALALSLLSEHYGPWNRALQRRAGLGQWCGACQRFTWGHKHLRR